MGVILQQSSPFYWGVWKIEETVEELLACFSDPAPYQDFLERKTSETRKKEWLACRVLLNKLLGYEAVVAYRTNGAPYLPDKSHYISISHTKGYVTVICHELYPVGIDIEYRGERIQKVRDRFLSPEENAGIDPDNQINHLLVCWCAKETLFKVIGEDNVDFRECLHISPFSYNTSGTFHTYETRTSHTKEYEMNYLVTDEFVLTYTIDKNKE